MVIWLLEAEVGHMIKEMRGKGKLSDNKKIKNRIENDRIVHESCDIFRGQLKTIMEKNNNPDEIRASK